MLGVIETRHVLVIEVIQQRSEFRHRNVIEDNGPGIRRPIQPYLRETRLANSRPKSASLREQEVFVHAKECIPDLNMSRVSLNDSDQTPDGENVP